MNQENGLTTPPAPGNSVLHRLLKERPLLFDEIQSERGLVGKSLTFLGLIVLLGGFQGLAMGAYSSAAQAVSSGIKVPVLLIGVMLFCLPALYVFNILLGSRLGFLQVTALLTMSTAVMAIVLSAFAPITLFCVLTGAAYDFFIVENVACFSIAGFFGLDYLWQGMRRISAARGGERDMTILGGWIVIYVLLGTQLAWVMRPFVGYPGGEFLVFRGVGGNFFDAVWSSIDGLLS